MQVSVVIPLYNRKELISYTLDSLSAVHHDGVELEVLVIDDGSQDGAYELVMQAYPWVKLYKNPSKGAPAARNFGMTLATHDFIHFLDSDDLVAKGFYTQRMRALQADTSLSGVYASWHTFVGIRDFDPSQLVPAYSPYPLLDKAQSTDHIGNLLKGWYLHPSSIVFRKLPLQQISGFNETLKVNQDVDLLFRFLVQSYMIQGIEAPPSLVRAHMQQRVGVIGAADTDKMETMFALREEFVSILQQHERFTIPYQQALGEFCFYRFTEYQSLHPKIAERFYDLSQKLYPEYQIKGGLWIRVLAKIIGNKRAVLVKKMISK